MKVYSWGWRVWKVHWFKRKFRS